MRLLQSRSLDTYDCGSEAIHAVLKGITLRQEKIPEI